MQRCTIHESTARRTDLSQDALPQTCAEHFRSELPDVSPALAVCVHRCGARGPHPLGHRRTPAGIALWLAHTAWKRPRSRTSGKLLGPCCFGACGVASRTRAERCAPPHRLRAAPPSAPLARPPAPCAAVVSSSSSFWPRSPNRSRGVSRAQSCSAGCRRRRSPPATGAHVRGAWRLPGLRLLRPSAPQRAHTPAAPKARHQMQVGVRPGCRAGSVPPHTRRGVRRAGSAAPPTRGRVVRRA
eukprot:1682318-Prymnesium_polylepis.1